METRRPHHHTVAIRCAPRKAPCPTCGAFGRRKQILRRSVRTLAYRQVAYLEITYGEYRAGCGCCATFRTHPPGIGPRQRYDHTVRRAVLDRILEGYVEEDLDAAELVHRGLPADEVERVIGMVDRAEYKRRQAPPGIKISTKAFGRDRRLPITNRYGG